MSNASQRGAKADPLQIAREACRRRGLDVEDAPIVEQMMRRPEACWSPCCNDDCNPCADDFAAAARLGQQLLEAAALTRPRERAAPAPAR